MLAPPSVSLATGNRGESLSLRAAGEGRASGAIVPPRGGRDATGAGLAGIPGKTSAHRRDIVP